MTQLSISNINAQNLPAIFKEQGVQYVTLDCINWPDQFPYKPEVKVAAAICDDALLLHYLVKEKGTAAHAAADKGCVWLDSCCEFFCDFGPSHGETGYYNIETNCIGKMVLSFGPDRDTRKNAPAEAFEGISRWSSLGSDPFSERIVDAWELAIVVPFTSFFAGKVDASSFKEAKINIYKCGDNLSTPHYVSLAPIATPEPDFHRPEFFVPASILK